MQQSWPGPENESSSACFPRIEGRKEKEGERENNKQTILTMANSLSGKRNWRSLEGGSQERPKVN